MNKNNKRMSGVFLLVSFLFSILFCPLAQADDINFLKSEIAEINRHQQVIGDSVSKMERFLETYPERVKTFEGIITELTLKKDKLKIVERNNLIKSIISLGLDTLSAVTVVKGLYMKSVKVIILGLAIEGANFYVGNVYTDNSYSQSIQGVTQEARAAMPEIEKLHFLLTLTQGEWRANVRLITGNDDVSDKQVVYTQITTLIEELEKNIDRAKKILEALHKAKAIIDSKLPDLKKKMDEFNKKKDPLIKRLEAAMQTEREENISAQIQGALHSVKTLPPITVNVVITGKYEADNAAWEKEYDKVEITIKQEIPLVWQKVKENRQKVDDEFKQVKNNYRNAMTIAVNSNEQTNLFGPLTEKINQDAAYSMEAIAEGYSECAAAMRILPVSVKSAEQAIDDLEKVKQSALELAVQEAKFKQLLELASEIESKRKQIQGKDSVDQKRMIFNLLYRLIPNFVNINKGSEARGYIENIAKAQAELEMAKTNCEESLGKYSDNKAFYEKAYSGLTTAYQQRIANIRELIANLENADAQVYTELGKYNKAVKQSGYSEKKGNIEYFQQEKFAQKFLAFIHKNEYSQAGNIAAKYENMLRVIDSTYRPYSIARDHCDYYLIKLESEDVLFVWDMLRASQVPENVLSIQVPSDISKDIIDSLIAKIRLSSQKLKDLPVIGSDENSPDMAAYNLFQLWKKLKAEGTSWSGLDSKQFFAKWDAAVDAVNRFMQSSQSANAAGAIMAELAKIRDSWAAAHKDAALKPEPKDDQKSDSKYYLTEQKINGQDLRQNSGMIVVTNDDLKAKAIEISARLNDLTGAKKMSISYDGGMFWQDIALSPVIVGKIYLEAERLYRPYLKILFNDKSEQKICIFNNIDGIVYQDVDKSAAVLEAFKAIAEAYEKQNSAMFNDLISRDFIGNKSFLEEGVRFDFDMFMNIRLQLYINRIEKRNNMFITEVSWNKTQSVRKTMQEKSVKGKTTISFIMENGKMKIQNLRGDLLFASLSPEIAESSGLSSKKIEQIKKAHDSRDPTFLEDDGDIISDSVNTIDSNNGRIDHLRSFDFDAGIPLAAIALNDLSYVGGFIHWNEAGYILANTGYNNIAIAPIIGYTGASRSAEAAGNVYYFKTSNNMYGKMEVLSANADFMTFRYAVQSDGSTNIKTK